MCCANQSKTRPSTRIYVSISPHPLTLRLARLLIFTLSTLRTSPPPSSLDPHPSSSIPPHHPSVSISIPLSHRSRPLPKPVCLSLYFYFLILPRRHIRRKSNFVPVVIVSLTVCFNFSFHPSILPSSVHLPSHPPLFCMCTTLDEPSNDVFRAPTPCLLLSLPYSPPTLLSLSPLFISRGRYQSPFASHLSHLE